MILAFMAIPTAFANLTAQGGSAATQTTSGLSEFFNTIWSKAPSWIAAMIVFACSFLIARIMKEKVVGRFSEKLGEDDQDVLILIGRATYAGSLIMGVTIALKIAGIDLTAVIAAVGFGLGFAMQDLIMNFLAGIFILLNRQFTIGDFIKVNDTIGQVVEIQSRATILKALDGTRVIVPNSELFLKQVISYTSNPFRRIEVGVGVEYRTDLKQASQAIMEALRENSGVLLKPEPAILITEFADSSINFLVRFWVDSRSNWLQAKSDVIALIKKRFDEEGINIPFPMRTLVFDRDTEDVVVPTYAMTGEEMGTKLTARANAEAELAARIAASHDRKDKMQKMAPELAPDLPIAAPVAPAEPAPAPVAAPAESVPAPAPAEPAVPAAPAAPKAVAQETGAGFLNAEPPVV